jgi:hypothetical protein
MLRRKTWKKSRLPLLRCKCATMSWWHKPDELLNLTQSSDIPPEPRRQFSPHEYCYNDSQLLQVRKRAIDHWIGTRYVEYRTLEARLNSFKHKWPAWKAPSPEAMSTAGYFYDGEFYPENSVNHTSSLNYITLHLFFHLSLQDGTMRLSVFIAAIPCSIGFRLTWLGSNMHATPHTTSTSRMWKDQIWFESVSDGSLTMTWSR